MSKIKTTLAWHSHNRGNTPRLQAKFTAHSFIVNSREKIVANTHTLTGQVSHIQPTKKKGKRFMGRDMNLEDIGSIIEYKL